MAKKKKKVKTGLKHGDGENQDAKQTSSSNALIPLCVLKIYIFINIYMYVKNDNSRLFA